MISWGAILRRQVWFAVALGAFVPFEVYAAFNGLVPLSYSGRVSYMYGYVDSAGNQSELTNLLFGWSAGGYIWRPWFATTSLALNVGLTSTNSTSSSSEGTMGTGNFSLGVFPRSRFPFSLDYARTDSRSQQFYDVTQVSGETSFRTTRLTLRQSYRPRKHNQLFNGWYNLTQFDGGTFGSNSQVYGVDYQLRVPQQTVAVSASHSAVSSRGISGESTVDVVSASHVYTPSAELGVTSLFSYVELNPIGAELTATNSQAFSSFFWRPEHRAVNVSGGVRLSENENKAATSRSLNTNLALGYRITRSLNMNASMSLGTSSSGGGSQTLSTSQTVNVSYTGRRRQWRGISYFWQWGASGTNSAVRTEPVGGKSESTEQQSVSTSLGHNFNKSWATGRASSLSATFSQSGSGSKSTQADEVSKTLNHGMSVGWNTRGRRGASYINGRLSDSRSFGVNETVFNSFNLSYATDLTINRLSSMTGNVNYQASRNTSDINSSGAAVPEATGKVTSTTKNLTGGMAYSNNRPFGIYNLTFTSLVQGSKQIDSPVPSTTLRWESVFRYQLGLLSTTLSFRVSESAGGNLAKSMNFQATRTF